MNMKMSNNWLQAAFHGLNRDSSTKAPEHQVIGLPCCGFTWLASCSWCCKHMASAWPTTQPHRRQRSGILFSNTTHWESWSRAGQHQKRRSKIVYMLEKTLKHNKVYFLTIISIWSYKLVGPSRWQQQNDGTQIQLHHVAFEQGPSILRIGIGQLAIDCNGSPNSFFLRMRTMWSSGALGLRCSSFC